MIPFGCPSNIVIKHFFFITDVPDKYPGVFILSQFLQASLIFARKVVAQSSSEVGLLDESSLSLV